MEVDLWLPLASLAHALMWSPYCIFRRTCLPCICRQRISGIERRTHIGRAHSSN